MHDLIERQAAIDALDKRFDSIPMEQTTEILLLRKDLRELPSAQPDSKELSSTHKALDTIEPRCEACEAFNKTRLLIPQPQPQRTGRWIEIGTISHSYICSVCGRMLVNITDGKSKVAEHYPFCHCGARMEGAE